MKHGGAAALRWIGAAMLIACAVRAAEPVPVMVQSAPGRFEIAARDASIGYALAAAAEEAWRFLAVPLGLPEAFSSPIFVRVVPASAADTPPFRAIVEAGGIVSVRLRSDAALQPVARRALVQGLLLRVGAARHGVNERLTCPLWLEHAGAGWWLTRADGAQLDALRHESAQYNPPRLDTLLMWQRGGEEPRIFSAAAVWLLVFLQAESGREREWPGFVQRLLAGEPPLVALAASYPGRFTSAEERELWWQTGYHHARRVRTLPVLGAAESRLQLAALARFVFAGEAEGSDAVVPLRKVVAQLSEPVAAAEIARRSGELAKLLPALHPFYRNAGVSLREVFAARDEKASRREALCATFEQDWRDATELEAAANAALDAMERRAR